MPTIDETDRTLLQSVTEKPKRLDLGLSPVWAIDRCFKLNDAGLVSMSNDLWVTITDAGRQALTQPAVEERKNRNA